MRDLNFLIYEREGYPLLPIKNMPRNYKIADNKDIMNGISSTEARRIFVKHMNNVNNGDITKNKAILAICPSSIISYIKENNL